MAEDVKQTGLLEKIAKDIAMQNRLLQKVNSDQAEEIDKEDMYAEMFDQAAQREQNNAQKNDRKEDTRSFKDRLNQSKLFGNVTDGLTKLGGKISDGLSATVAPIKSTFDPLMIFKTTLFAGFLIGLIKFFESSYWETTKKLLIDYGLPLIQTVIGFVKDFFNAFGTIGDNFSAFIADPSFENLKALFGDVGTLALGIGALLAIFAPFKLLALGKGAVMLAAKGFKLLFGAGGRLARGIGNLGSSLRNVNFGRNGFVGKAIGGFKGLFSKGGVLAKGLLGLTSMFANFNPMNMLRDGPDKKPGGPDKKPGAPGQKPPKPTTTPNIDTPKKPGMVGNVLKNTAKATKFIPGLGLLTTAVFGVIDGVTAGVEEYKNGGTFGSIVKESASGVLSGLTFGLISQETFSGAFDATGQFFSDAYNMIPSWEETSNAFGNAFDAVGGFFSDAYNSIPSFEDISSTVGAGLDYAKEIGNKILGMLPTSEDLEKLIPSKEDVLSFTDKYVPDFLKPSSMETAEAISGATVENMEGLFAKQKDLEERIKKDSLMSVGFSSEDEKRELAAINAKILELQAQGQTGQVNQVNISNQSTADNSSTVQQNSTAIAEQNPMIRDASYGY